MEPRGLVERRDKESRLRSVGKDEFGLFEMDRKQFLRFCGIGAIGITLLSPGAGGLLESGDARAQGVTGTGSAASPGSLRTEFEAAASEYGVPMRLLMAMGYINTRWEMPPLEIGEYVAGDPHKRGVHGIMALVQNPYADTLGLASRVTGIAPYSLKTERFSNIRGGAALVSEAIRASERLANRFSGELPQSTEGSSGSFNDLLEAIAGDLNARLSAVTGVGGGMIYARQVLDVVHAGASLRTMSGELATLEGGTLQPPRLGGVR